MSKFTAYAIQNKNNYGHNTCLDDIRGRIEKMLGEK